MDRDTLPKDADNYDVFCERCQRVHRFYTFTQEDYDRVVSEGAQRLAEAIDQRFLDSLKSADRR